MMYNLFWKRVAAFWGAKNTLLPGKPLMESSVRVVKKI